MGPEGFKLTGLLLLDLVSLGNAGIHVSLVDEGRFLRSCNQQRSPSNITSSGALIPGLIHTNFQPMFEMILPNLLDPSNIYNFDENNSVTVEASKDTNHSTGLVDSQNQSLTTTILGYREAGKSCTWPGHTFEIQTNTTYNVLWSNKIPVEEYLLTSLNGTPVVDATIHWAYGLPGYTNFSISSSGVPIVTHFHGGHSDYQFDGRSESFFSPDFQITGPDWSDEVYQYRQKYAGLGWYHDHTLGLTRLNIYAGLSGFFVIRDNKDTGKPGNAQKLPAFPYEVALVIQDRMFKEDGSLFYPSFPGDPAYHELIEESGAVLPSDLFPNGGPTLLTEYFGDVIVVNGKIWPKMEVEPRNYRFRLLNACDSRFLIIQFVKLSLGATEIPDCSKAITFNVIGSSGGIALHGKEMDTLVIEPAGVYDVVINFEPLKGYRIAMRNIGPDEPFAGYFDPLPPPRNGTTYLRTDRVMALDVVKPRDAKVLDKFNPSRLVGSAASKVLHKKSITRTRRVGLFEGSDGFGRILPLLGNVDPATDCVGNPVYWPQEDIYQMAGLAGQQMQGTSTWYSPTTEYIKLGSVEEWEIWNFSEDAHPFHLHLVLFQVLGRNLIVWDSNTTEASRVIDPTFAHGDGTFLAAQPLVVHDGSMGQGMRAVNPTKGGIVSTPPGYFENVPKNMVVAAPGQITRIKAIYDKVGSYVWHCHILSHEDHAMMRPYEVCQ